jgi:succinate dehydrogenase / fumarate reductase iron-sulfur subunit
VLKDLVPDLTELLRPARLHRALAADADRGRRRPSGGRPPRSAPSSTGSTSASCAPAAPRPARATGGTATGSWGPRPCSRPIAGSSTAATRPRASASTSCTTPSGSTAATRS